MRSKLVASILMSAFPRELRVSAAQSLHV